jgi:hypothetical protein
LSAGNGTVQIVAADVEILGHRTDLAGGGAERNAVREYSAAESQTKVIEREGREGSEDFERKPPDAYPSPRSRPLRKCN